jgi:hypothetical protein
MVEESLSQEKGGLVMTIAEMMRKEGFEQGIRQGIQQGIQQSIRETIEFGLGLRFGDEGLAIMPLIRHIQDNERLRVIRDAVKTVKDLSELKGIIGN